MTTATRLAILAVDDRPENLFALEQLLARLNIDIVRAASGPEALGIAIERDFCLAIVDVQMPGMDGYELVELLRGNASTATLPVIFVSAIYSDEYHHRMGYDAGAVDFLSKPFIPEILLSKVRVFLELAAQQRALRDFNAELERQVEARTAELKEAYRQLEQLDRKKSDFIHIVSHELRTPLTLVMGYSQMLLADPAMAADGTQRHMLAGISTGARRMHDIVNAMLDMARIDTGTLNLVVEQIDAADLLAGLADELAPALLDRQLTLTLIDTRALPAIPADATMIRKLFEHLLLNAIKYTPNGGRISVSWRCLAGSGTSPEFVEFVVQDTGIGIAQAAQELIFTKFYQTGEVSFHSTGRTKFKGGGPGLGLAIARGIVAAHGGRIWVESAGYDEAACPGSAFHIILPATAPVSR